MFVLILIGSIVAWNLTGALEPMTDTNAVASYSDNIIANAEENMSATAFNLTSILIIVLVSALIIGVCLRGLGEAFAPPPGGT